MLCQTALGNPANEHVNWSGGGFRTQTWQQYESDGDAKCPAVGTEGNNGTAARHSVTTVIDEL